MLGLCLSIQLVSGFFLSLHYISYSLETFDFIIHLMRDVWMGWFVRFFHINGASFFFFFLYLHLFRGLFYLSSSHYYVWISGFFLFFLLMAVSFLGYVLPWGQMSYWAVAVITNLLSVVPFVGDFLVVWVWGGFTVGLPTLIRFYSLHFILPFVVLFLVFVHIIFLHVKGSRNPLGLDSRLDKISFHPYFTVKDFYFFIISVLFFLIFIVNYPYLLSDPVNNVPANFIQTPLHIQPEWYFLPYYAILRSIPRKIGGVICLLLSVFSFLFIILYEYKFSTKFSVLRSLFYWLFSFNFVFLIKIGALPAEDPYVFLRKLRSFLYFVFIFLINF